MPALVVPPQFVTQIEALAAERELDVQAALDLALQTGLDSVRNAPAEPTAIDPALARQIELSIRQIERGEFVDASVVVARLQARGV